MQTKEYIGCMSSPIRVQAGCGMARFAPETLRGPSEVTVRYILIEWKVLDFVYSSTIHV